jgi:hypothetical protein
MPTLPDLAQWRPADVFDPLQQANEKLSWDTTSAMAALWAGVPQAKALQQLWKCISLRSPVLLDGSAGSAFERLEFMVVVRVPEAAADLTSDELERAPRTKRSFNAPRCNATD